MVSIFVKQGDVNVSDAYIFRTAQSHLECALPQLPTAHVVLSHEMPKQTPTSGTKVCHVTCQTDSTLRRFQKQNCVLPMDRADHVAGVTACGQSESGTRQMYPRTTHARPPKDSLCAGQICSISMQHRTESWSTLLARSCVIQSKSQRQFHEEVRGSPCLQRLGIDKPSHAQRVALMTGSRKWWQSDPYSDAAQIHWRLVLPWPRPR